MPKHTKDSGVCLTVKKPWCSSETDDGLQISIMWLLLALWALLYSAVQPFRSWSSNVVLLILQWQLIVNATFALYTGTEPHDGFPARINSMSVTGGMLTHAQETEREYLCL